ncbi:MAG: aminotransferase class V-fold PLP-dependent enzyme [Thermoanaerobaculum sp.]|nr:aminotransferase class V-fold PLP-dependent enzyme [Thermoanaerobaculum sp.]
MELSSVFPIREECLYLDHATLAPLPQPTVAAMSELLALYQREGFWQLRQVTFLDQKVRSLLSLLVGCQPFDVSLFPSFAVALTALLAGLQLPPGSHILLALEQAEEARPLAGLLDRLGHRAQVVEEALWDRLPRALEELPPGPGVVVLPWVDALGWAATPELWADRAWRRERILVLDSRQAVPCRPESFAELDVDALLLVSHTWLLGPPGAAALITTHELRQRWQPLLPSFRRSKGEMGDDAACFEGPPPAPVVLAGLAASLEILSQDLTTVRQRILNHQRTLTAQLVELGWSVDSPGAAHPVAGIVAARHRFFPPQEVQRRLQQRHVWVGVLGPWVRFSPHFYTTGAELHALPKLLARL